MHDAMFDGAAVAGNARGGLGGAEPRWLDAALACRGAIQRGAADDVRGAIEAFLTAVRASDLAPGALVGDARTFVASSVPPDRELCGLLGVLFSAFKAERDDSVRGAREAAAFLCSVALEATVEGGTASIAVRLARLREELGDAEGARDAWYEAYRRDPLLLWVQHGNQAAGNGFAAMEQRALDASAGAERDLRRAIQLLASGAERPAACTLLADVARSAEAPTGASLLLATERVRDAARAPLRSPDAAAALAGARELLDEAPAGPLRDLLRALVAILTPDYDAAVLALVSSVDGGVGNDDDRAAAAAIVDALTEMIRTPPYDALPALRAAYFDAMVDPLAAILLPRGPMAIYRRQLLTLALAAMVGNVGCASALAQGRIGGGPDGLTVTVPLSPFEVPAEQRSTKAQAKVVRAIEVHVPDVPLDVLIAAQSGGDIAARHNRVMDKVTSAQWTPMDPRNIVDFIQPRSSRFAGATALRAAMSGVAEGGAPDVITAPGGETMVRQGTDVHLRPERESLEGLLKLSLIEPAADRALVYRQIDHAARLVRQAGVVERAGRTFPSLGSARKWHSDWCAEVDAARGVLLDDATHAKLLALGALWSRADVMVKPGPTAGDDLETKAFFAIVRLAQIGDAGPAPGSGEVPSLLDAVGAAAPEQRAATSTVALKRP